LIEVFDESGLDWMGGGKEGGKEDMDLDVI